MSSFFSSSVIFAAILVSLFRLFYLLQNFLEFCIGIVDVNKYIGDAKIVLPKSGNGDGILTGEEELDRLIGLNSVKRMIKKIKAYAKRNKDNSDFNMHMCFYGNPGTGKTEVARILSRILYDAGVLDEAKLVETDSHGLLGKFVGETAPKTEAKINEANLLR